MRLWLCTLQEHQMTDICDFSKVSDYNGGLWKKFSWKLLKVFLLIQERFFGNIYIYINLINYVHLNYVETFKVCIRMELIFTDFFPLTDHYKKCIVIMWTIQELIGRNQFVEFIWSLRLLSTFLFSAPHKLSAKIVVREVMIEVWR